MLVFGQSRICAYLSQKCMGYPGFYGHVLVFLDMSGDICISCSCSRGGLDSGNAGSAPGGGGGGGGGVLTGSSSFQCNYYAMHFVLHKYNTLC